jgi:predicted MPP superfamily phosphohydrolase
MIELFHVSDTHVNKKKGVKEFLAKIKEEFKIEEGGNKYLLITGDITDDGKKKQYKTASAACAPFAGLVRVVPGNHDIGDMGFIYHEKSAKYFDDPFLKELKIKHQYFKKTPFVELFDDKNGSKVLLIGLNSCSLTEDPLDLSLGEIGEKQLHELESILNNPEYTGVPKIVMLHHIPHRRAKGIGMSLRDYKKLMAIVRGKVEVLAFGHQGNMEEVIEKDLKKLKIPENEHEKIVSTKQLKIPTSQMKLRSGKSHRIRYYLDANSSVQEYSCYHIKIEKNDVSARIAKLK